MTTPLDEQTDGVAVLHDPTRRALFSLVSDSVEPVSREQASAELGVTRSLAGFHLDKLVEAGLLDVELRHGWSYGFGRRSGALAKERARSRDRTCSERATFLSMLREHGFEPRDVGTDVVLVNCPFHGLAQDHADLVCGMNLHLLRGMRSAVDIADAELQPRLEPEPGHCCVRFRISGETQR